MFIIMILLFLCWFLTALNLIYYYFMIIMVNRLFNGYFVGFYTLVFRA